MNKAKELIKCALRQFMVNDWSELINLDAHEITISHRIAVYLENKFSGYNIDLEYNRDKENVKQDSEGRGIRPDIIIHRRNTDKNLCMFEIKKNSIDSDEARADIQKLRDGVDRYNYELGVFLAIERDKIEIYWIENVNGEIKETLEVLR